MHLFRLYIFFKNTKKKVVYQVKAIERRFNELGKRIQRKKEVLKSTEKELKDLEADIGQAKQWVSEKESYLRNQPPIGFETKASEERLQLLKVAFNSINDVNE